MKILAIANSFSQDACAYLHQTARSQGVKLNVYNLYIGGCPLEKHVRNLETGEAVYDLQHNGKSTGRYVSIMEMLQKGGWDAIITQQASHDSGWMDSYEPFLGILTETFGREAPGARLLLQQTWAYEHTSTHAHFLRYNRSQQQMYERLTACYRAMAQKYQLELIPCGDLIQQARALPVFDTLAGGQTLCRDGFHMNLYGRYLLALVWLRKLCGTDVSQNRYRPLSGCGVEKVDKELLSILRTLAQEGVTP